MSHGRERKEKDCLNCGSLVEGRYCQVCGQENIEPHETFFGMVNHFFSDITHFDGKFFKTVGILASKPGYLSRQYISGKRNSFLHPVRMYVFTSALFFLVAFSFYNVKETGIGIGTNKDSWATGQVKQFGNDAYKNALTHEDSMDIREAMEMLTPSDSTGTKKKKRVRTFGMDGGSRDYHNLKEYDSAQAATPADRRDGWLERLLVRKGLDINDRYPGEDGKLTAEILNKFMHTLPYLLFISLPLYGFFLYLLYVRRKRFFFADHAIFLIHLYIFTFIIMLVIMLLTRVPYGWVGFLIAALFVYGIVYTLKAFRNFYAQGWGKTIFKFVLFNFISLVSLAFLFALFFGYALFQV